MNKEFKQMDLIQKIKYICSIPVKDDGRALNIIFILCLISIIGFSVFLFRSFNHFYDRLDNTVQNNIDMNIEYMQNQTMDHIQSILDSISSNNINNNYEQSKRLYEEYENKLQEKSEIEKEMELMEIMEKWEQLQA